MTKRFVLRAAIGTAALFSTVFSVNTAHAYNWKTHSRMTEVAAEVMDPTFPLPPTPAGVDPTQWNAYINDIHAGIVKYGLLKTGLGGAEHEETCSCNYRPTDNMSQIPYDRIKDMTYLPLQGGIAYAGDWVENGMSCSEVPIDVNACPADATLRIGRVLGANGANADNHTQDTALWWRPTNALFAGEVKSIVTTALDYTAGAMLLPFVCLWDLFTGKSCDFSQAKDLATEVDPIDVVEGLIPGFFTHTSYDYVGLWHFVDVASPNPGSFNPTPGMLYTNAGPYGQPGAFDVAIGAGAGSFLGMSLNADESDGVSRYGQFDATHRSKGQWQGLDVGMTEFSPIINMGEYGFTEWAKDATTAFPLTWVFHALGDAAEPQHVAGTTAWGHRPYEDEVDILLDGQLLPPPPTCALGFLEPGAGLLGNDQATRILLSGFQWWTKYRSQFHAGQAPIQAMVLDLAQQTFTLAMNAEGASPKSVYNDWASTVFLWDKSAADAMYQGSAAPMRAMLENGVGAMIAFLAGGADTITSAIQTKQASPNPNQLCPSNLVWDKKSGSCLPVALVAECVGTVSSSLTRDNPPSPSCGNSPACGVGGTCPIGYSCAGTCCQAQVR
jgi:hypothetical protein